MLTQDFDNESLFLPRWFSWRNYIPITGLELKKLAWNNQVEVQVWISNYIPHFTEHVITYPNRELNQSI